jgi:hypothetical protein
MRIVHEVPPDHTFESKIVSGYLRKQAVLLSLVDVSIKVCGLTKNASILNKDIEVLTKTENIPRSGRARTVICAPGTDTIKL